MRISDVMDFHRRVAGYAVRVRPGGSDTELRRHFAVVKEEFVELMEELYGVDACVHLRASLDGLRVPRAAIDWPHVVREAVDMIYVVTSLCVVMGLPLRAAWERVHQANMRKLGRNGQPVHRADGWTPPDIAGLFR